MAPPSCQIRVRKTEEEKSYVKQKHRKVKGEFRGRRVLTTANSVTDADIDTPPPPPDNFITFHSSCPSPTPLLAVVTRRLHFFFSFTIAEKKIRMPHVSKPGFSVSCGWLTSAWLSERLS